jgi:hypothetical protein
MKFRGSQLEDFILTLDLLWDQILKCGFRLLRKLLFRLLQVDVGLE